MLDIFIEYIIMLAKRLHQTLNYRILLKLEQGN